MINTLRACSRCKQLESEVERLRAELVADQSDYERLRDFVRGVFRPDDSGRPPKPRTVEIALKTEINAIEYERKTRDSRPTAQTPSPHAPEDPKHE